MEELKTFYRAFREYKEMLAGDEAHRLILRALQSGGSGSETFASRLSRCEPDQEWILAIEDALPAVERALDEQRRFIQSHEEIRRIDQARKTGVESIRHLAQHSNMISHIENGDVVPDKILIVERDDNYAIYENRFLYTLVMRLQSFMDERYKAIADLNNASAFACAVERDAMWNRRHLKASVSISYEQRSPKPDRNAQHEISAGMERLVMLRRRINQLTGAPLMKLLQGVTPVASPIVRTNVFKKNDNFKRALELFEFLENYRKPGYEIVLDAPGSEKIDAALRGDLWETVALQTFVGQLGASDELRDALEANFLHENELAEQERIRQEEERERQVLARIQAARDEEIEIRRIEVAKREAIIAEKTRIISELEAQISDLNRTVQALTDENAAQKAELQQRATQIQALESSLESSRSECSRLHRQTEALETRLAQTVAAAENERRELVLQHDRETAALNASHEAALAEQKSVLEQAMCSHEAALTHQKTELDQQRTAALESARAETERLLSDKDRNWQQQLSSREQSLRDRHERELAARKRESDQQTNALQNRIHQEQKRAAAAQAKLDRANEQLRHREDLKRQLARSEKELHRLERQNAELQSRLCESPDRDAPAGLRRLFRK